MVTVELFKGIPFNNGSVMSNFTDYTEQNNYFTKYDSSKKKKFDTVKISSLYNPIVISESLTGLYEYTYGRIIFNENKRCIYFSINRFEIITDDKTYLYFDIDYWETYRYPLTNDSNSLVLGRGRLKRCSLDLSYRKFRAYNPIFKKIEVVSPITPEHGFSIVVCWHNNLTNWDMVSIINDASRTNINEILSNRWIKDRNFDSNQIFSCWLSPFYIDVEGTPSYLGPSGYKVYDFERQTFNQFDFSYKLENKLPDKSEDYQIGLTDANHNLIWISPDSNTYKSLILHLGVSMSSCNWYGTVYNTSESPIRYVNPDNNFTIPCEPLDVFSDAFISYYTQVRPFNIESRRIQRDQAFISGITNVGTSAIGGAVAGSMVAPGPGTIAGAIGGAIASVVGTTVNYQADKSFSKQITAMEDKQAKLSSDELRFSGNAVNEIVHFRTIASIVKLVPDTNTLEQYKNDISSFGYYYDVELPSIDTLISNQVNLKITCEVEVENVPEIAISNIKGRLNSGVTFIKPNSGN